MQHGAVSAERRLAMVTGVAERFDGDYALSVTGFRRAGGWDGADAGGHDFPWAIFRRSGCGRGRCLPASSRVLVVKSRAVTAAAGLDATAAAALQGRGLAGGHYNPAADSPVVR